MKRQDRKDRYDESKGMKKYGDSYAKGHMDSKYYGMISEDNSAPANLPQDVKHTYYPKCDYFHSSELDDTIRGLDDTRNEDIDKMERYESNVKY